MGQSLARGNPRLFATNIFLPSQSDPCQGFSMGHNSVFPPCMEDHSGHTFVNPNPHSLTLHSHSSRADLYSLLFNITSYYIANIIIILIYITNLLLTLLCTLIFLSS